MRMPVAHPSRLAEAGSHLPSERGCVRPGMTAALAAIHHSRISKHDSGHDEISCDESPAAALSAIVL
jgi:hypothetical protein